MLKGIKQELNVVASIQIPPIIHVHVLVCFPTRKVFMKCWTTSVLWAFCVKCAKRAEQRTRTEAGCNIGTSIQGVAQQGPEGKDISFNTYIWGRSDRACGVSFCPCPGSGKGLSSRGGRRKLCWEQSACRPRQRNNLVRRVGCQGHGKRPEYELL